MVIVRWLVYGALLVSTTSAEQPTAPSPVAAQLRELPWGKLNFLHTTDTHGWHAGHLQEAQYAADWGDYVSFAEHLQSRADDEGVDLLIVDTGDRVDGNGLYDASSPRGKYTSDIIQQQKIDIITSGNHELYKRNTSAREYDHTVPDFRDAYIASNIDIIDETTGKQKPLAARFRRITTKNQGIRIIAFGFLYNFHGNDNNTVIQNVEDTIKEEWFQDAISEKDVDLFIVAGHLPVRKSLEMKQIYHAIRKEKWDTPIAFFGGHTHIRDYHKFEKNAWALESGRYMETIGFMSINGLSTHTSADVAIQQSVEFRRLYIDNNLYSLQHHAGKKASEFATKKGKEVSKAIQHARKELKLDHAFGCAPDDYWLNRAPYPSNASLVSLLEAEILPDAFRNSSRPIIALANTGGLRFDVFKGPFTTDSTFLVSPFTSAFRVIPDVPYKSAKRILSFLNNQGQILLPDLLTYAQSQGKWSGSKLEELRPARPPVREDHRETDTISTVPFYSDSAQIPIVQERADEPTLPGYTTRDDGGEEGDDTVHAKIRFWDVPNCVAANVNFNVAVEGDETDPATVDVAYNEFIQDWVLLALKYLGESYSVEDTQSTLDGTSMTAILADWVQRHWPCEP